MLVQLWRGECTLWKAFWIFGVLNPFIFYVVFQVLLVIALHFWVPGTLVLLAVALPVCLAYSIIVSVAIWRSAGRYRQRAIWCWLARSCVLAVIGGAIWGGLRFAKNLGQGSERNSRNIETLLRPDEAYPYVGFWKSNCRDHFGVAIEKAGDGLYSVSFCGPGGGFMPGKWAPNTTLTNDPAYRIIDANTIEFQTARGVVTYRRCEDSKFFAMALRCEVIDHGLYRILDTATDSADEKITSVARASLLASTDVVPAQTGTCFGFRYVIRTTASNPHIDLSTVILSPDITQVYSAASPLSGTATGMAAFGFDLAEEIISGTWTIRLMRAGSVLTQLTFDVVEPQD